MQLSQRDFDQTVSFLKSHSADQIPHLDGTLLPHLEGTCELLRSWGNTTELCLAGLCHTVYGTTGFPHSLLSLSQRSVLESVIGLPAEQLVYFYASCDRAHVYPQIIQARSFNLPADGATTPLSLLELSQSPPPAPIQFRDRFSGAVYEPTLTLYRAFLELTFANELEILRRRRHIPTRNKASWRSLFSPCRALVSAAAFGSFIEILGEA